MRSRGLPGRCKPSFVDIGPPLYLPQNTDLGNPEGSFEGVRELEQPPPGHFGFTQKPMSW